MILKRVFDVVCSLIALIVLSPVFLILVSLVYWKMGSPVLYRQKRPGWKTYPFLINKFRTMVDRHDASGALLPDRDRITALGSFLRSSSLDELPELWNVLVGDMSLVGPRPLLMQYLERYTFEQNRRHEVRPGITGWAQIHGRNTVGWEERLKLDVWYVDHRNFFLDFKIILITIWKIVKREGISAEGHATMPEFEGSKETKIDHNQSL